MHLLTLKHTNRLFCQTNNCAQFTKLNTIRNFKVALIGACGGIGQPLAMLLKLNPLVTQLSLYDLKDTKGIALELNHVPTKCTVKGQTTLSGALKGADIVVSSAGMARKKGMNRADLFDKNALVIAHLAKEVAKNCPHALFAIITNPINTLIPLAAEVMKKACCYDPLRLFGVTTLDVVRSERFIGEHMEIDPKTVRIPVIGGHDGNTIIPLFSQCKPEFKGDLDCTMNMVKRIQVAGTEVVKAKDNNGSATLSMAVAGERFLNALLMGLNDEDGPPECAYVESNETEASFFATPLQFGTMGIKKNLGIGELCQFEMAMLKHMLPALKKSIKKGVDYGSR